MVGGSGNTISGSNYGLTFGKGNTAPTDYHSGLQMGQEGDVQNNKYGALSTSAGKFSAVGDAQLTSHLVYRGQTTNNTATVIYNAALSSAKWVFSSKRQCNS